MVLQLTIWLSALSEPTSTLTLVTESLRQISGYIGPMVFKWFLVNLDITLSSPFCPEGHFVFF